MKIFLLYDRVYQEGVNGLKREILSRVPKKSKLSTSRKKYPRKLPAGYDVYLLHPSNTGYEAVKSLRKTNPSSVIYFLTGMISPRSNPAFEGIVDSVLRIRYGYKSSLEEIAEKVGQLEARA